VSNKPPTFVGYCRGGPMDGKQIEHDVPFYRVVIPPRRSNARRPDPQMPAATNIKVGQYVHVANQWIWKAPK
jgi:hypothetical protein